MVRQLSPEFLEATKRPPRDYVEAVRCRDCHKLRKHPDSGVLTCSQCGSLRFVTTIPSEAEVPLALKLYASEVERVISMNPSLLTGER